MVERVCSACQHGNVPTDRYCGKCGTPLERQLPARISDARLVVAGRHLPVTWSQLSRTVALSAAALAAEVGLTWLRRRMDGPVPRTQQLSRIAPATPATNGEQTSALAPTNNGVTIISQRVVDVWDAGDGHRRVVEQTYWRRTED